MRLSPQALSFAARHDNFTDLATRVLDGIEHMETPFDSIINDCLQKTCTGDIKRLIINIPPGFGKTLSCVWAYVARGFALNPASRFIHASYSDKLVQDNSSKIRDLINHTDYQTMYPYVNFKEDSKAKGLWKTNHGGSFLASPSGGAITGFRAGLINSGCTFSGALIIDDPLKPDDAMSDTKRDFINQRWENTFRSRLANPDVPVIVIMQRIHEEDFTWHLLENTDEEWHHVVLPVLISDDYEYKQSGKLVEHGIPPGPLWEVKHSAKQSEALSENIQYSQEPTPAKGEVYEREWFNRYDEIPPLQRFKEFSIHADTASKDKKYNDYTVFQLWGLTVENTGYMLRQWRDKVKIPFLLGEIQDFYEIAIEMTETNQIEMDIEDKDSGVGLIQALALESDERGRSYKVEPIQRTEGKYARAVKAAPKVKAKLIYLPTGPVGDSIITEATKFKADNSHKHDDQIDPMADFINFKLPEIGYDQIWSNL